MASADCSQAVHAWAVSCFTASLHWSSVTGNSVVTLSELPAAEHQTVYAHSLVHYSGFPSHVELGTCRAIFVEFSRVVYREHIPAWFSIAACLMSVQLDTIEA